jgi:hypothetical protein
VYVLFITLHATPKVFDSRLNTRGAVTTVIFLYRATSEVVATHPQEIAGWVIQVVGEPNDEGVMWKCSRMNEGTAMTRAVTGGGNSDRMSNGSKEQRQENQMTTDRSQLDGVS